MAHRGIVAGIAVLVLLSSVPLFKMTNTDVHAEDDQAEFEVNLRAPEGTSLESTEVITNRIASALRQQLPEVEYTLVTVGGDPARTRNLANIYVRLTPIEARRRDQFSSWRSAQPGSAAADARPADLGSAGRQHRRRGADGTATSCSSSTART